MKTMVSTSHKSITNVSLRATLEVEKKSMAATNVRPLNDDGPDTWDDDLIPAALIKEIYDEQFSSLSSGSVTSEESYDFITESGTVLKLRRKKHKGSSTLEDSSEEDEEEMQKIPSVPDIEGGISKAELKNMSVQEIEQHLASLGDSINFVTTENLIFERTIARMEQRDREIEAAMPIFTYKYPWENENGNGDMSASNSDSDDERRQHDDGCGPPVSRSGGTSSMGKLGKAHTDENVDEEEEETETERKSKKKQKKKVIDKTVSTRVRDGGVKELCEWEDSEDEAFSGKYNSIDPNAEISVSRDAFFDGMSPEDRNAVRLYIKNYGHIAPPNYDYMRDKYGKLIQRYYSLQEAITDNKDKNDEYDDEIRERQKIFDEMEGLGDEDPDFPGFYPRSAKRLPLEYKFKYAEEESEALERDIMSEKTKVYRRQNAIQVLIDTNVDSYDLLNSLNDELTLVIAGAYHPLTKRLMAEKILKFRKQMRNKILAEETKITMSLVELKKTRKKVQEQFKAQKEMGFKLQKIDFEQIRIRNNEYTTRIESAHEELKGLKLLTAGCFQILKEERQKLTKKLRVHERMVNDIHLRENLMHAFQSDLEKYTQILGEVQARNAFMRKRLRAFKVPNSMEYIQLKAVLYGLEEEVATMKNKLRSLEIDRTQKRMQLKALSKTLPPGYLDSLQENDDWVEIIKKEVEEKHLLTLLPKEELEAILNSPGKAAFTNSARNVGRKVAREKYDPEEDSKSIYDIIGYRSIRSLSRKVLQPTGKSLLKAKPGARKKSPQDLSNVSKCPSKYRRIPRGHLVVDTREALQIEFMTKC